MAVGRDQILQEIATEWMELQGLLANVPAGRIEAHPLVGNWSVKDLMGHITTWEAEAMMNIEGFLGHPSRQMRTYPDVDGFNERTVAEKRAVSLEEARRDLVETHTRLVQLLEGLPAAAFDQEPVAHRIQLDSYGHYKEHSETLRGWLSDAG